MKKYYTLLFVAAIALAMVLSTGCGKDGNYKTTTVSHEGFDFSSDGVPDDWNNSDGETVSWHPGSGSNSQYPNNDAYIWWRNTHLDANGNNMTKDMGKKDLEDITDVPTSWDGPDDIMPLIKDHVIVAKCKDGYVKFKVKSADSQGLWEAEVDYVFTKGTSFDD